MSVIRDEFPIVNNYSKCTLKIMYTYKFYYFDQKIAIYKKQ